MVDFDIVLMGYFRNPINKKALIKFKSKTFRINSITERKQFEVEGWHELDEITDDSLVRHLSGNTFERTTLVICDKPLEGNWYLRLLNEKVAVLSLYQISNILLGNRISLESFIIKTLVKNSVIYHFYGKKFSVNAYSNSHLETRKCLFDFNREKTDIVYNTHSASLCEECIAKFNTKNLPENFRDNVRSDLKSIKADLFYVVEDFIKSRPVLSLFLATLFAISLNVIASYIYEAIKRI